MAASDRRVHSECKFQLRNKHKQGLSIEKVSRSKNMKKEMINDYII